MNNHSLKVYWLNIYVDFMYNLFKYINRSLKKMNNTIGISVKLDTRAEV